MNSSSAAGPTISSIVPGSTTRFISTFQTAISDAGIENSSRRVSPGLRLDLLESDQPLQRRHDRREILVIIDLRDFLAFARAGVLHVEAETDRIGRADRRRFDLQVRILELV